MSDKYHDVQHEEIPEEDREFFIEFGWLAAASVAIATAAALV